MSRSPKSNPISYNLKEGSFTVKDIDRIYDVLRRRARAAFKHRWAGYEQPVDAFMGKKIKELAEAIEYGLTASWEHARQWADRSVEIVRFGLNVEHERWFRAQKLVNDSKHIIKNYEADCFSKERNKKYLKTVTARPQKTWLEEITAILKNLWRAYPFVTTKNRHRLTKLLRKHLAPFARAEWAKSGNIYPKQLLEAGIPAVEIVGPWWTRTKEIKSPIDWVRTKYGFPPTLRQWLEDLGLDQNDRQLVQSLENYYAQHKAAPSVEWARRRSNALEEERMEAEVEEHAGTVEEWLETSAYWRRSADYADVVVPPMPDPTFHILGPGGGETLCRMAKRDGLCVVDAIVDLVENSHNDDEEKAAEKLYRKSEGEGFVTLVISSDPKRRTVVGLNSNGICTSEHHCTGMQNKVDKVAYEYFRQSSR